MRPSVVIILILVIFSLVMLRPLSDKNKEEIALCKAVFNDLTPINYNADMRRYSKEGSECCSFELEDNKIYRKCRTIA